MEYEITPVPEPAEREALLAALQRLAAADAEALTPEPYRSEWRQAGMREQAGLEDDP